MPWDRKRLLGYVEIIQYIVGVTDKTEYQSKRNLTVKTLVGPTTDTTSGRNPLIYKYVFKSESDPLACN